ncbi:hypothetical protein CS063_11830 [Sporanaerobium hydrogeniformans]|uniref:Uncharacterized protein n=1 Tax=Sporanaerobium hydrogeniformans TaxID=3072179 RepID=A0AC61DB85_9FIRM|nr:DUF3880 domain-containing protein [Sporanaerobium hydrogeniformans]PHV70160.1 hypothetical protein CS063_11830 [Sporanaerobium hydrogeniformans]
MGIMKKGIYRTYKVLHGFPGVVPITHFFYNRIIPYFKTSERPYIYRQQLETPLDKKEVAYKQIEELTIAIICDEMTFAGFKKECKCVFVTPSNWMEVFRKVKPDLFFCESTWSGINKYKDCWRGRIYKNGKAGFENRKDLLHILDFCQKSSIPTVFWNKEDPTFFHDKEHDFVSTALLFDYIYTTAEECIPQYKELGHEKVNTLMFGFSPQLFNPLGHKPNKEQVIFVGSWYQDQTERCEDMKRLFDTIIDKGLKLEIYDRHSESGNPLNQFPEQYKEYIHPSINFEQLSQVFKRVQFGININTVKDSKTMFARRVFEMMASNLMVVSNDSKGMRELFGEKVWFINESIDLEKVEDYCQDNLRYVFLKHTCRHRLVQVATEVGILQEDLPPTIYIIYKKQYGIIQHFNKINYQNKIGLIERNNQLYHIADDRAINEQEMDAKGFVIWISKLEYIPNLAFMQTQFSYIEEECGISEEGPRYSFEVNSNNEKVLFKLSLFKKIKQDRKRSTKKYFV